MSPVEWNSVLFCRMSGWSSPFRLCYDRGRESEQGLSWMGNVYCCLPHIKVNCFWSFFLLGMEKNVSARSLTGYHELEAVLSCGRAATSKVATAGGAVMRLGLQEFSVRLQEPLDFAWVRFLN